MTRIISGQAGGRRLRVPARGTRPTSDRVRESCFSSLESALQASGESWSHTGVLDLYAGSGALGLEALSRGARAATLVESDREALRILRENVRTVGLPAAYVVASDVLRLPPAGGGDAGDARLVFADPPYDVSADGVSRALAQAATGGWVAPDATIVVERSARDTISPFPPGWTVDRTKGFGDTALWYGRATFGEPQGTPG